MSVRTEKRREKKYEIIIITTFMANFVCFHDNLSEKVTIITKVNNNNMVR